MTGQKGSDRDWGPRSIVEVERKQRDRRAEIIRLHDKVVAKCREAETFMRSPLQIMIGMVEMMNHQRLFPGLEDKEIGGEG